MLVFALMLAAATPQEACVALPKGATAETAQARNKPWYISGEAILLAKKKYTKYGLPRILRKGDVEFFTSYMGAGVYAEAGNPQREVLYMLTDFANCEFQPYQVVS